MADNAKQYTPEEIAAILKENEALKKENEDQTQVIAEMHEVSAIQKGSALPIVVSSSKKKYQVLAAKLQHPETREVVLADDLAKDKKLIDLLVKKQSGVLKEIV